MKHWRDRLRSLRLPAFSLLLAMVAWFLVHSAQRVREEHNIAIVYRNLPKDLAFARKPPEAIRFGFVGIFHRLRSIDIDKLSYEVDLSEAKAGTHVVDVTTGQFFFSVDVDMVNPRPRRFEVLLEPRLRREVPVQAKLVGPLPPGFALSRLEVRPNPITIDGPVSALSKLDRFEVEIKTRGNVQQWEEFVEVPMPEWSLGEGKTVEVSVELSKLHTERDFRDVPVVPSEPNVKIQVFPSRARVVALGAEDSVRRMANRLKVEIPVKGLAPGRYRLEGQVPEELGIQIVRIEPKSFIVEVLK